MKVRDLIRSKGFEVIAIDGDTLITDAVSKMIDRNIGALLIVEEGKTAGMFTERDVLKCWAAKGTFEGVAVKDVMTKNLFIAELDDDVSYAMSIMIQNKVRHLPVLDKGRVVSVLSIRDLVTAQVSNLQAEVHYLKDYITDKYPG
ncbi:MAG: CBS domain-containing protein [Thermodesulfovibrionales bacterium]|nr:CBS domain-containing protein [Thermodesulfovibrionales bacterium]